MRRNSLFLKATSSLLIVALLLSGCSSTTLIQSYPPGAKCYVSESLVGVTPCWYSDSRPSGTRVPVRLEKEGYEPFTTQMWRTERVDVGAIIGGLILVVPYFWILQYKRTRLYEMKPIQAKEQGPVWIETPKAEIPSKAQRLEDLKALYEHEVITQDEYETARAKILEE